MREPRRTRGARALLLDRLVDESPQSAAEPAPLRVLDRDALLDSVRREVKRLLNTRCTLTLEELEGRERTVLEYGLPDFSHLHTRDPRAQEALAEHIRATVAAYEPRLRQARIAVEPLRNSQRELLVRVDAMLVVGDVMEAVSFPVAIHDAAAQAPE
ncbi:MAG TPA: type VI secretion system baseplate subunit TssE [Longimicrobiaceae bacterium]|nr:type VI secretion system baseplate subunit TssE [Longimicrobiaceae bacterium]